MFKYMPSLTTIGPAASFSDAPIRHARKARLKQLVRLTPEKVRDTVQVLDLKRPLALQGVAKPRVAFVAVLREVGLLFVLPREQPFNVLRQ